MKLTNSKLKQLIREIAEESEWDVSKRTSFPRVVAQILSALREAQDILEGGHLDEEEPVSSSTIENIQKICLIKKKKNKKNNCYRRTKMSKISKEGYEQIKVIKNALDSMFDKLDASGNYDSVKDEFEAIAGIVEQAGTWTEV